MAIFKINGLDNLGKEIKTTINAENLVQAKAKAKSSGIMLLGISEQKSEESLRNSKVVFSLKKIDSGELAMMTRQLATLVKAQVQIVDALSTMIEQNDNEQLRIVLSDVRQKVNEGSSLANALKSYPKLFNNVYINMVDAGEVSGNLSVALLKLAEFNEGQERFKKRLQEAMIYPIIMMVVIFAITIVIFVFMIPKIADTFTTMKQELPMATKICMAISAFLVKYWIILIVGIFLVGYIFLKYINTAKGRSNWDAFLLKVPKVNRLIILINIERFCSTLATLLESSVPIIASMRIVSNIVANTHMKKAVDDARVSIGEGASMVGPLNRSGYFPPMVTNSITLGEKSGELSSMLKIVAENYGVEVSSSLTKLTTSLGPIMLIVMGIVVGVIVFAVVLPIVQSTKLLRM